MSLVLMGSTSGSITLQEPAVAGSTVLNLPATTGTVGLTTSQIGMKNRIINGAMVIDQRSAGASVTPTTSIYTLDRWTTNLTQASKFSVQQNAGSVTPPTGFTNYLGVTSLSAYSVLSSDYFAILHNIEGFNTADLDWGTANAKTVTLSFWVRSSLTGTFGGSITNSAINRSYPFSYTISSANTWTQISVTISGDTTGTWIGATNGVGMRIYFSLGAGSTYSGTAGSWAGATYTSSTGATSVVGTNGATFYITGVQFELGSVATTFDFRSITTELALCQRYYWKTYNLTVAPGTTSAAGPLGTIINGAGYVQMPVIFPVAMRGNPTITFYNDSTGAAGTWRDGGASDRTMSYVAGQNSGYVYNYTAATNSIISGHLVAAIEL